MKLSQSNRTLIKTIQAALDLAKLPPRLTVSEWSDTYRRLSSESSSKQGQWRTLPMQKEPMDSVLDPDVESTVLMWASQTAGKTEVLNNIVAYFIDQDPSPMLMVQPTVEMGESWSKDRLAPMIRDTPRLRGRLSDIKSRDSGNTITHKVFPGGHLTVVGANAPAGLSMRPIRVVVCDEVDRYPFSAGDEGDPISLAEKRTDTFWDAVLFKTSTPTVKNASRIEAEFKLTDQRYWHCPCPECGEYQTLKWKQVRWPKGNPEAAAYVCEKCLVEIDDAGRVAMIQAGEWIATAPFTGKRGYHLSGIYTLFRHKKGYKNRLHQMAAQFLEANKKGESTIRAWINTFLAETWEGETERQDALPLMERIEKYGPTLPGGVLCLVATVDVQADRLECLVVGYGTGEEAWCIGMTTLMGNPNLPDVWRRLGMHTSRTYQHAHGKQMRIAITFIDSGGQSGRVGFAKSVYAFVKPRQMAGYGFGSWACKGMPSKGGQLRRESRQKNGIILQLIGGDESKSMVYSRLQITDPGPRYIHFPSSDEFTEEWFKQLTGEEVRISKRKGFIVREWIKVRDRNEALDLMAYQMAALDKLNPDWNSLSQIYAAPNEKAAEAKAKDEPSAPVIRTAQPAQALGQGPRHGLRRRHPRTRRLI